MDELTENAEDIAEEGEKKEEIKLGRLQYKVGTRIINCRIISCNLNGTSFILPFDCISTWLLSC